jgi:hypothetical protein
MLGVGFSAPHLSSHRDRCESSVGGGLCWVGLARAFKMNKA